MKHEDSENGYLLPYHWCLAGFYRILHERKFLYARPYLRKEDVVLDFGGGDGRISAYAAPFVKEIWCADENERALNFGKMLAEGIQNLRFQKISGRLDFADRVFDKCFFIEVLEHLSQKDSEEAMNEIHRVLKPGALLFLSTPNRDNLRARIFGRGLLPKKHEREYNLSEIENVLQKHGFEILERRGLYLPPPIPKIEHYANIFPLRAVFRALIGLGKNLPRFSETIWIMARRR